jgi:electron transfer flavoprotein beta subunit
MKGVSRLKILVLVKETFDTETKIVLENSKKINNEGIKYIINPYDEFAIEEALRIREKFGGEVIIYSVGRRESEVTLRNGLALGADKAKLIVSEKIDSITVSKLLAENITKEEFEIILSGWIAIDDNNAQVPARLSQLLDIPLVNVVTKIDFSDDKIICHREGDNTVEIIKVSPPAMIAVQRGINEPRYPTVKNILQAKKKQIDLNISENNEDINRINITYQLPEVKKAGLIIDGSKPEKAVNILIQKLKEAKVL